MLLAGIDWDQVMMQGLIGGVVGGAIGLVAYLFKKVKGDDKPKSDGPSTGKRNW